MKLNLSWQQVTVICTGLVVSGALVGFKVVDFHTAAQVLGGFAVGLIGFDKAVVKS